MSGAESLELRVEVLGFDDSDDHERASLAAELERVLLRLDVEEISKPVGEAPEGAKGSAIEWAQLIVTGIGSLPAVLAAIQSWRGRTRGATIKVEIDGDSLVLTDASETEREPLIDLWVARHAG